MATPSDDARGGVMAGVVMAHRGPPAIGGERPMIEPHDVDVAGCVHCNASIPDSQAPAADNRTAGRT